LERTGHQLQSAQSITTVPYGRGDHPTVVAIVSRCERGVGYWLEEPCVVCGGKWYVPEWWKVDLVTSASKGMYDRMVAGPRAICRECAWLEERRVIEDAVRTHRIMPSSKRKQ